jgi:hypothetical protein
VTSDGSADVGVSYGLAGLAGLLNARSSDRWRRLIIAVASLYLITALQLSQTFTNLGHLAAWTIGLGVAWIARQSATAASRGRHTTHES